MPEKHQTKRCVTFLIDTYESYPNYPSDRNSRIRFSFRVPSPRDCPRTGFNHWRSPPVPVLTRGAQLGETRHFSQRGEPAHESGSPRPHSLTSRPNSSSTALDEPLASERGFVARGNLLAAAAKFQALEGLQSLVGATGVCLEECL